MRAYSKEDKLVLDTGVFIEYIVRRALYRSVVERLFTKAVVGRIKLYTTSVTLSETLYIASRIYEAASEEDPNRLAADYIKWIRERVSVIEVSNEIIFSAGELKKTLHLALPDCYVIASASAVDGIPLFRSIEREMKPVLNKLKTYGVKFLEELEI
ncbi:PIN domain nuclease [Candidatus Geothermarchaeota archaeon]|nr:MAG: PIN domain nuclease [Candidatus Geothermarchaeota archaeon]